MALGVALAGPVQAQNTPAPVEPQARPAPPRVQPEAPRPRPRDPRDRAFMDGGMPGFSGLGTPAPGAPRAELAPRPNLDIELRGGQLTPETARISPTMIHPRMPGRAGSSGDGAAAQTEQRFLQTPAAGARLSVPMTW